MINIKLHVDTAGEQKYRTSCFKIATSFRLTTTSAPIHRELYPLQSSFLGVGIRGRFENLLMLIQ